MLRDITCMYNQVIRGLSSSGSFKAAKLPGQATCAVRAVGLWVEKNPVPPPNRQALDWSVVLTVRWLCPIVPQDYSGMQKARSTKILPGQCPGVPRSETAYGF